MFDRYEMKLVRPMCHTRTTVNAVVELDTDIKEIFPYLNGDLGSCFYHPDTPFLRFIQGRKAFTLHPNYFTISGMTGEQEARNLVEFIRHLLTDTWARRGEIEPSYRRGTELKMLDVFKLLPWTNCGDCGEKSCMAFAGRLIKQESTLEECAPLQQNENIKQKEELIRMFSEAGLAV
ncbi:Metal-binding trascriptional regulator, contains putative Fe-S cluster and ArsR family DNA binding domain [Desulfotomaculum arcticum]|uniref:Metal-binding trascriptional regulator, contains putative Fe-S cluster and ArsR family DNA binding domain n=1 Tax=Desulfotruncus arcticus DSM 17038 TaxID=1121424 RepID=A0A1I2UWP7_9FIRM|nr:(Fe-S)-binding protein [Desulfotruncus arcticus]SFG81542.1 Metal-binding trascriptional regulator, contains putative Fe-S cluster and ArsR family DNA binding domain [Desulfotomaculum arcticum] [Desulfotruncus arcticus DSM 17038]